MTSPLLASGRTTFRATGFRYTSSVRTARYTVPIPPCPQLPQDLVVVDPPAFHTPWLAAEQLRAARGTIQQRRRLLKVGRKQALDLRAQRLIPLACFTEESGA